ncbi:bifunctional UDP-N-acetylglucosamine diphosphorylase/glucosamine-1-phosphate N-acetyltransferase GlmU [Aureimonas sp. AU12]|uniref:bifunctional UDP-N-acetylglucosamine diphosphorylase/glucosamine-1-phosphate N-acetyltransferase GlmU n=1 Tax=Aureimonas sp. AU12 TaxID=1638161 RepID=UPI00078184EE|nr:bifunctional UDP-N-acetylglucosamine diphosphorylase/glucosamine-1-phosphate N-acetyltransferase GlmU [Aureimonas sp. AU12]
MSRTCLSIVLAAGEGTRMKSAKAKVLHDVAGRPLVLHAAAAAEAVGAGRVAVVVGREAETVSAVVRGAIPGASTHVQAERLGTAHAVLAAREALAEGFDDVIVLFGDTPLVRPETLALARSELAAGAAVCVVGFRSTRPTGYGRLILRGDDLVAIREEKDASEAERRLEFCNGGVMAIDGRQALSLLDAIGNANAKGEFYLTDIVEVAASRGLAVRCVEAEETEVLGVNTRVELARVEGLWQARRRDQMMLGGVTLAAPETVFFAYDTTIAADVVIEPHVVFGPGVTVASGATIHAFSHLEGASVGEGVSVGPFARLRPGTDLGAGAKVGNFVETKNARIGPGAKVSHLTYLGDAVIGAETNIGAGTITCNYDGFNKFVTEIGAGVFIGSNSSLVAPLTIGDGAYVGSGSVVTDAVPPEALALGRARQVVKEGRGREINARNAARKKAAAKPIG